MPSASESTPLAPRSFPTSGFEVVDHSELVEEETLPEYKAERYYPVHIGQVFNNRYQVVGKLGYGVTSTVWLARDLVEPDDPGYIALKVYVTGYTRGNELAIYECINSISAESEHSGRHDIRKLLSSFEIQGSKGKHMCIVHQALGITMERLLDFLPNRSLGLGEIKTFLRQLLIGLDFLHTEAGVIHTDIQLKNLLLPVGDPLHYEEFEEGEYNDPAYRKILKDRTIYGTRYMSQKPQGHPLICDFGEARFFDQEHDDDIMPDIYRAPEVVMHMNWNYKVDIWSVAMVAWDLVASHTLFHRQNPETNEPDDRYLIAEMTAVMGPPPLEYRRRSKMSQLFWDENGEWKETVPLPNITLESLAEDINGDNKEGFLRFLGKILRWLPEERPCAEELLYDPWLMDGLSFSDEEIKGWREEAGRKRSALEKRSQPAS
ncbi:hypothetical protein FQN54_004655 [Arachnomyces sp. PD_36]|nr:hypothetical protein FQN54_004655 [Arachnomyces sp. PD_36]